MAGKTGFGVGGVLPTPTMPTDKEMKAAAGDTSAILQLIQKDIRKLSDKYAETPVNQPRIFTIAGSATNFQQSYDLTATPHNSFIIMVQTGTVNLFLGEYTQAGQSDVPNYGQWVAGEKGQFFLELAGRKYVLVNPSTTVTATAVIIPLAI